MTADARRRGWLLTAVLAALVVVAAVLLVRLLNAEGAGSSGGAVDGTTPAVAGARVESEALKQAALAAAQEQVADDVAAGIISVTARDATVLLFVDTVSAGDEQPSLRRVVVTLRREPDRDEGRWRVTGERGV